MRAIACLCLLFTLVLGQRQRAAISPASRVTDAPKRGSKVPAPTVIHAITPTSPGQIGVNPATILPDASAYIGDIGTDTKYLTKSGSSTKWIGVNTEYITVETSSSGTSMTTTTIRIQVEQTGPPVPYSTVPSASRLLLPDVLVSRLNAFGQAASKTCNGGLSKRLGKRQSLDALTCLCNFVADTMQANDAQAIFNIIPDVELDRFALMVARNIPAVLAALAQVIRRQAEMNKISLLLLAALLAIEALPFPHIVVVPKDGLFSGVKTTGATSTLVSSGSAAQTCTITSLGDSSPLCAQADCRGEDQGICQQSGSLTLCPCFRTYKLRVCSVPAIQVLQDQQDLLSAIANSLTASPPPVITAAPTTSGALNCPGATQQCSTSYSTLENRMKVHNNLPKIGAMLPRPKDQAALRPKGKREYNPAAQSVIPIVRCRCVTNSGCCSTLSLVTPACDEACPDNAWNSCTPFPYFGTRDVYCRCLGGCSNITCFQPTTSRPAGYQGTTAVYAPCDPTPIQQTGYPTAYPTTMMKKS